MQKLKYKLQKGYLNWACALQGQTSYPLFKVTVFFHGVRKLIIGSDLKEMGQTTPKLLHILIMINIYEFEIAYNVFCGVFSHD